MIEYEPSENAVTLTIPKEEQERWTQLVVKYHDVLKTDFEKPLEALSFLRYLLELLEHNYNVEFESLSREKKEA